MTVRNLQTLDGESFHPLLTWFDYVADDSVQALVRVYSVAFMQRLHHHT